jgi:hypothetical protein
MRRADIQPGWHRARLSGGGWDTVRVERIAEPRYAGDSAVVVATRFQVRGPFEARFTPAQILERVKPNEKFMRIIAVIEEAQ